MAEQDPQLDLKKRARRRLVGAAALALLAAIVLPLIMDQEPKPVGQDIQIRIPSQNAPGAPLLADKPSSSSAPSPVSAPVEPAPAPAAGAAPAPATPPAAVSVPVPTAAPVAAPAKTEEKPKPVTKAEADPKLASKATPPVQSAPTVPAAPSDQARAEAILNGSEASGAGAASGQFIVQLGVFGDAGNVKKLRERIKGQGYNSFTENLKTDKGVKIRVRAGPFPTKEAAAKARDSLRHHTGIDGIVTEK